MLRFLTKQGASKLYLISVTERSSMCKCNTTFLKKFQASSPSIFLTLNRHEHSQSARVTDEVPELPKPTEKVAELNGTETVNEGDLPPLPNEYIAKANATTASDNVLGKTTSVTEAIPNEEALIEQTLENITPPDLNVSDLSIPPTPDIPLLSVVEETIIKYSANGDPTLESVGLGGWTPSGIVQQCLNYLHCDVGLPWWGAILAGTIVVRLCVFPIVVKAQRASAKMSNHMPQIQRLQTKMSEARQMGNAYMAAKYAQDMTLYMQQHQISPIKGLIVPFTMAPIFISCFFAIRGMANLPIESMKTGGLYWFTDLTVMDPYYALPLICCTTVFLTFKTGADGAKLTNNPNAGPLMKYVMRGVPVIMFPFIYSFPAGVLCYWVSTNAVSLLQVSVLKIPRVRDYLKIERPIIQELDPVKVESEKKGFVKTLKDSWTNMKISREMEERERFDETVFKRAGRAPIPKTYKYDPTKAKAEAIQAKSNTR